MLLRRFLERIIHMGQLTVIDADGVTHRIGPGGEPAVTIRLHDSALHWKLFFRPYLYTGEAYMDGTLTIEDASLYDFLDFMGRNFEATGGQPRHRGVAALGELLRRLQQLNSPRRARRNAAHHYDLSGALYDLFLDADRQYSCAYFLRREDSIDEAQQQKRRHIAAKLRLEPGMRVLDIGSGWGGLGLLARRLPRRFGHRHYAGRGAAQGVASARGTARPRASARSSSCATTGRRPACTTGSYPSACSSTSGSAITMNSSVACATDLPAEAWRCCTP